MSDLPPAIKAAQEKLRPRIEAQTKEMESLAAAHFAARLANAEATHDVPAEEALAVFDAEMEKNQ